MIAQLVLSIALFFILLVAIMLFYMRYQSKVPYYRMTEADCVNLLVKAVQGNLPEQDWDMFIGMMSRDNEQIENLRTKCYVIDDAFRKETKLIDGRQCVRFHSEGLKQLTCLLDEWQHKTHLIV